jgi:hypothetical protein
MPLYNEAPHHEINDLGDHTQSVDKSLLEYHKVQTNAAFQRNAKIPGFSTASLASGMPPVPPIYYQSREDPPYPYSHGSLGQNAAYEPLRSRNSYSNTSVPSPKSLPPTVHHARDRKRPSSNTPAVQNVEEGELSEGEFEEARPEVNRNIVGRIRRDDYYEHQREDRSYRGAYDSSGELEATSNAPLTG